MNIFGNDFERVRMRKPAVFSKCNYTTIVLMFLISLCTSESNSQVKDKGGLIPDPYDYAFEAYYIEGTFGEIVPFNWYPVKPGSFDRSKKRLMMATKVRSAKGIALSSRSLGWINYQNGNLENAINNLKLSLVARKELKEDLKIASAYCHLAYVQIKAGRIDPGIKNYSNASEILSKSDNVKATALIDAAKAQAYFKKKDYDAALENFKLALKKLQKLKEKKAVLNIKNKLGEIRLNQNEIDRAIIDFRFCMNYMAPDSDPKARAVVLRNLGIAAFKQGRYEDAADSFENSLKFDENRRVLKLLRDSYLKLSIQSNVDRDFEQGEKFGQMYQDIKDSLAASTSEDAVSVVEAIEEIEESENVSALMNDDSEKYKDLSKEELQKEREKLDEEIKRLNETSVTEFENLDKSQIAIIEQERMAQIEKLNKERALQDLALSEKELEISNKTRARNLMFAGASLFFVTSFFMFNRARLRQKSLQKLDSAYSELSETHSQLKSTQDDLIHSQKMASIGQLTAGVAHEIQNPLNFVTNFSVLSNDLINDFEDADLTDEEKKEVLEDLKINLTKIHEHGMRADKIVKGMLMFSRTAEVEKQDVSVHQIIDQYIDLAYRSVQSRHPDFVCNIVKDYHDEVGNIKGIHQDLGRVFLSTFNNAFYALREKAERIPDHKSELKITTTLSLEHEHVHISVYDNGTGINEDAIDHIFTPFFTTKPTGEGTGLGLSLSYDIIVKGHSGSFKVDSEEGKYTDFQIIIPLMS